MYHTVENFTQYFKRIKSNVKLIHESISEFPWLQENKLTHVTKQNLVSLSLQFFFNRKI